MENKKLKKSFSFKKQHFAFPYTLISIVFVVVPLFILIYYAFTNRNTGAFTLENFNEFSSPAMWKIMGISFLMAFCTTLVCLLLAYPLAMALCRIKSNKTFIIVMLFILPMWINSLLRIYSVKLLFHDYFGLERGFLLSLIGMVYDFFPFMLLPIYTILSNMNTSYFEASTDLGSNPVRTFLKVKLPLSIPGIVSGILMVFMPSVSTFAINDILGSSQYWLFGNEIYFWFANGMYNLGAALALVMLLLIVLSVLVSSLLNKIIEPRGKPSKKQEDLVWKVKNQKSSQ